MSPADTPQHSAGVSLALVLEQSSALLALTQQMVDRARQEDWDAVEALTDGYEQASRQLQQAFEGGFSVQNDAAAAAVLQQTLAAHEALEALVAPRRAWLGRELALGRTNDALRRSYSET